MWRAGPRRFPLEDGQMRETSRAGLAFLFWVALAGAGSELAAGEPPDDPLLGALVAEALERNPDLLAARESAAAARARPDQARALPDPMLSILYTNDGWSPSLGERDMTTLGFLLNQDLPYPGKRGLQAEVLARQAGEVSAAADRVRLGVVAALKRAYYGLLLARDEQALLVEQQEVWNEIEGVARARYAVGEGAQQDVLRVQVEVTRLEQRRSELQAEVEVRLAELNALVDRPADAPLATTARLSLRPEARDLEALLPSLEAESPELRAALLASERQGLEVSLARKEGKPDFSVQAGYMNRGGLDAMWQAGLGVSLPLSRKKRQGLLLEAEALLRSSQRRGESLRLQLRSRTQQRLSQLRATERIAEVYGSGIIPQVQMSVEAGIASYQAGKLPFISVLEALTRLYGDRTTYLQLLARHETTRAALEEARLEDVPADPMGN
jgi:outer membrane protein TolC